MNIHNTEYSNIRDEIEYSFINQYNEYSLNSSTLQYCEFIAFIIHDECYNKNIHCRNTVCHPADTGIHGDCLSALWRNTAEDSADLL